MASHANQITKYIRCLEANSVVNPTTEEVEEYWHLIKGANKETWTCSLSNELGQLAQGIRNIKGTDTITAILKSAIPKDKKVTYGTIVYEMNPHKNVKEKLF